MPVIKVCPGPRSEGRIPEIRKKAETRSPKKQANAHRFGFPPSQKGYFRPFAERAEVTADESA